MNIYQQDILDHYHNPRNSKRLEDFDYSAKLENLSCGDEVEYFLKLEDGKVSSVGYTAEGCAISIASASKLSEELIGKSLEEILQLDIEFMFDLLGIELTVSRQKCAKLSLEAVKSAIENESSSK